MTKSQTPLLVTGWPTSLMSRQDSVSKWITIPTSCTSGQCTGAVPSCLSSVSCRHVLRVSVALLLDPSSWVDKVSWFKTIFKYVLWNIWDDSWLCDISCYILATSLHTTVARQLYCSHMRDTAHPVKLRIFSRSPEKLVCYCQALEVAYYTSEYCSIVWGQPAQMLVVYSQGSESPWWPDTK